MFQPRISQRVPSSTLFAEIFQAPGPQQIGVTGDNSYQTLFGRNWLAVIDREGVLRAYQEQAPGEWTEVSTDLPPIFGTVLPAGVRRISLAFDQSARAIVCYEQSGIVQVTRWDNEYQDYRQNVSFPGVDPVAVMDATWSRDIEASDVLLFYLTPDRRGVRVRVQRDVYSVAHAVYDYEEAVILDRAAELSRRFELLLSDIRGAVLDHALVSGVYPLAPYRHRFGTLLQAVPLAGIYRSIVTAYGHAISVDTAPTLRNGDYVERVTRTRHSIPLVTVAELLGGEYAERLTKLLHGVAVETSPELRAGAVKFASQVFHSVTVETTAIVAGGVYE